MKPSPCSQSYLVLYQERELSFLGFYQFSFKRKSAFLHKERMQILSSCSYYIQLHQNRCLSFLIPQDMCSINMMENQSLFRNILRFWIKSKESRKQHSHGSACMLHLSSGSTELSCHFHNILCMLWHAVLPERSKSRETILRNIWRRVFSSTARDTPPESVVYHYFNGIIVFYLC